MEIALAPEIEERLREEAVLCDVSVETYVNQSLATRFAEGKYGRLVTPERAKYLTPEEAQARREKALAFMEELMAREANDDDESAEEFLRNLEPVRFREFVLPEGY